MDEQAYPLCANFENNCDMTVPLFTNYVGYYHSKSSGKLVDRVLECWQIAIMNYRQHPGSDYRTMEMGQFVIHSPHTPYVLCLPRNETMGYYWIYFTGNYVTQLLDGCGLKTDRIYTIPEEDQIEEVLNILKNIFLEAAAKKPGHQTMITAMLVALLTQLGRNVSTGKSEKENYVGRKIEKSRLYILSNYSDPGLSVSVLAEKARLSESRYRELFRKVNGMPPSEYLLQVRITHACDLLRNTGHDISKIAEYCGYQNFSYFSRLFRKKTGMTPSQYRHDSAQ